MRPEQAQALQPVADALMALGYDGDPTGVWDAALRMVWVPDLVADMLALAALPPDQRAATQPVLQRPLPEGHTVGSLMSGYAFNASGAFLLGAALVTHTTETLELLRQIRENGRTIMAPDGTYSHISVPAGMDAGAIAAREGEVPLPAPAAFCMRCGAPLVSGDRFCAACGAAVG